MRVEEIELVKTSWSKVQPISEEAADMFYGKLFELDPSLKDLFSGDMKSQSEKLMKMINTAVNSAWVTVYTLLADTMKGAADKVAA